MYRVKLYGYDSSKGPHFVEERTVGSLKAARLYAEEKLKTHPIVTTNDCYHRDVGRSWSVSVYDISDPLYVEKFIEGIIPEIRIVPSVGELGYTP
jgi:hypothetical protein